MDKLSLCSKILYDKDLLEKREEIDRLNKIINVPRIKYSKKEWIDKKQKMYNTLESCVWNCIISDEDNEFYNSIYNGLSSRQRNYLNDIIYKELNNLTKDKFHTWCSNLAWDIVYGIEGSIQGLIETDKINNFTEIEIANFIYKNLEWQLNSATNNYCIIDDIPIFEL
jgi:hypothetical protein